MKSKTILPLILLVICVVPQSFSQDFWEELYFPDSAHIRCIALNNDRDVFVGAGSNNTYGGVYRSYNIGQTWDLVMGSGDFSVQQITINDQDDIYIGKLGFDRLMFSNSNGNSWDTIDLPSYSYGNIMKIYTIGFDTIYVSTWDFSAILLRSYDNGVTWDSIIGGNNHIGEYVSDMVTLKSSEIFVSMMAYHPQLGGIYKSADNGYTWEFSGLLNHMISSLATNSDSDIFAGVWGGEGEAMPGLYVLRNGKTEWDTLIAGPQVDDLVINSEDHIYFSSTWPNGVVRSVDNGESFEIVNDGLPSGPMGYLTIDNQGYLYVTSHFSSNFLAKSINPTVSLPEVEYLSKYQPIVLYPNPTENLLNLQSFPIKDENQTYQISIINSIGQLLLSREFFCSINNIKINVNNLKSGLYFVNVSCEDYSTTCKLIKN